MRTLKVATAASLLCALMAGAAQAQTNSSRMAWPSQQSYRPGQVISQTEYRVIEDRAVAPAASPSDKVAAPAPAPIPGQNQPAVPVPAAPGQVAQAPAVEMEEPAAEDEGWKLFRLPALEARRIDIRGWLEQGYTWNPDSPANRFNGPIGYNDRSNEYMLNQFYFVAERVTNTDERSFDIGGRVDAFYGEDWRYSQAFGLENTWDINQHQRFYGLGLPQFYGDVAYENLTLRGGHFLAPLGYEAVTAPDNFFYSHSYQFLYSQPTTLSGGMLKYKLNDKWSVNSGIDTGWNDWDAKNGKLGYFGGVNWNPNDRASFALELNLSNEQPSGIESTRTHLCGVFTYKLNDKLTYAFETNYGNDSFSVVNGTSAQWYGASNYLLYQLNDRWAFGTRFEMFVDEDGAVVNGLGAPHGVPFTAIPANWYDLSFGVNFKPNKNVIVRSEARWDWIDRRNATTDLPFDDGTDSQQFTLGNDLIIRF